MVYFLKDYRSEGDQRHLERRGDPWLYSQQVVPMLTLEVVPGIRFREEVWE